ncbi:MAG: hypothetical protein KatS3mg105_0180 [Gemmatales bacterium]|nr:MAG: hypothetical protein KatS3mg105_0180 [Gemmatales bacterium]
MFRFHLRLPSYLAAAIAFLAACGCETPSHTFSLFGYSTAPLYDTDIRTVYVPIFENRTFRKRLEFDLTRAVVEQIQQKTPYKVVSDPALADTELRGTIVAVSKNVVNVNQLNEVRQADTVLSVEVVWRDLRTGKILSAPTPRQGPLPVAPALPAPGGSVTLPAGDAQDGTVVPLDTPVLADAAPQAPVPPARVTSASSFIPELGQSITTAFQGNVDKLAVQIVSMMEKPW